MRNCCSAGLGGDEVAVTHDEGSDKGGGGIIKPLVYVLNICFQELLSFHLAYRQKDCNRGYQEFAAREFEALVL